MDHTGLWMKNSLLLLLPACIGVLSSAGFYIVVEKEWLLLLIVPLLLLIWFYGLYVKRTAFLLFCLFSLFGFMNVGIKPFDMGFVFLTVLFLFLKKIKFYALKKQPIVHFCLLIFTAISFLSVPGSGNIALGFSYFIHTLFLVSFFYFLILSVHSKKLLWAVLAGYVLSAAVSATVSLGEIAGIFPPIGTVWHGTRATGFFLDPNDFSPFLILAVLLSIEWCVKQKVRSFLFYGCLLLAFILISSIFASLSRAALLNLVVSFFIYYWHARKNNQEKSAFRTLFICMGTGLTVVFLFAGEAIANFVKFRFQDAGSGTAVLQSYDSDRFYFQIQGLKFGLSHLFGIGPGQFEWLMNHATHNLFVRIIAENGFLAFLPFFIAVIAIGAKLFLFRHERVFHLPVYLFLAVYIGMIINSFFLDTLHWRFFWFFLALSYITSRQAAIQCTCKKAERCCLQKENDK